LGVEKSMESGKIKGSCVSIRPSESLDWFEEWCGAKIERNKSDTGEYMASSTIEKAYATTVTSSQGAINGKVAHNGLPRRRSSHRLVNQEITTSWEQKR